MKQPRRSPLALIRSAIDESPARRNAKPTDRPYLVPTPRIQPLRPQNRQRQGSGSKPPGPALRGNNNSGAGPGFQPQSITPTLTAFFRSEPTTSPQEHERHGCRMNKETTFALTDLYRRKAAIKIVTRPPAAPTVKITERPPAVQLHRIHPTGQETLLGVILRDDLCRWLEHPTYPVTFNGVSLVIHSDRPDHRRIGFLFHDAMWILTTHEEHRLYRFLEARRRRFTDTDFTRRLNERNIHARACDTANPNHLVVYFDAQRSNPTEDLATIRELPEVDGTVETLHNKSPYIHLIILSGGDATWSLPGQPRPDTSP